MESPIQWTRVNHKEPCTVCQKPDWCTRSSIGSCCMRISSEKPMKNGGWLHTTHLPNPNWVSRPKTPSPPPLNANEWMNKVIPLQSRPLLEQYARRLGVTVTSLESLNCRRAPQADTWAFPMRNAKGQYVGIRLRHNDGSKWAVPGSRQGIFLPQWEVTSPILVCEGPTDTAAALSLGYYAIGRPSCSGSVAETVEAIIRTGVNKVAIIADNDGPGMDGAVRLQHLLPTKSVMVLLPTKDIREYLACGGTKLMLDSLMKSLVWKQPK